MVVRACWVGVRTLIVIPIQGSDLPRALDLVGKAFHILPVPLNNSDSFKLGPYKILSLAIKQA